MYISSKKTDFSLEYNSSGKGEASFMLPKTLTDRDAVWENKNKNSVGCISALLSLLWLQPLMTPTAWAHCMALISILQQYPSLPWCSNPIYYCAPWRTMNVPISICLFVSVSLYYFTNLFSLSGKWPNLLLIFFSFTLFLFPLLLYWNYYNSNWYRCFLSVYWGMSCRLMTLTMFNYLFYIIINKYASCI